MVASSGSLHEDPSSLTTATIERHRAIVSLMEELEAIDWYDQRVAATSDDELRDVLAHNRDEEKEHACMVLEWLRRHDPVLDQMLRTYLFADGHITGAEGESESPDGADLLGAGLVEAGLAIGGLKGGSWL